MAIDAFTERMDWRACLDHGVMPEEVKEYIKYYKQYRLDPTWRAARGYEALGEAALFCYERMFKDE